MELSNMDIREQICDVCHKMWQLGWGAANDGNVSVKLVDNTYLATPTGISKSFITPEKIVHIDADCNIIETVSSHTGKSNPMRKESDASLLLSHS